MCAVIIWVVQHFGGGHGEARYALFSQSGNRKILDEKIWIMPLFTTYFLRWQFDGYANPINYCQ